MLWHAKWLEFKTRIRKVIWTILLIHLAGFLPSYTPWIWEYLHFSMSHKIILVLICFKLHLLVLNTPMEYNIWLEMTVFFRTPYIFFHMWFLFFRISSKWTVGLFKREKTIIIGRRPLFLAMLKRNVIWVVTVSFLLDGQS